MAPFADSLNHDLKSQTNYSFFHKNLHLQSNKIYLHETDFETFDFDTSNTKQKINISRLFRDDSDVDQSLVSGVVSEPEEPHPDCF